MSNFINDCICYGGRFKTRSEVSPNVFNHLSGMRGDGNQCWSNKNQSSACWIWMRKAWVTECRPGGILWFSGCHAKNSSFSTECSLSFFFMVWFIFGGLQYILKHFLLFLYVVSIRVAWEDPSVIRKWCVYSTQSQNHTVISKHSKDLFLSPCVCVCVCVPCMQVFAWLFLIFAGDVFWRWHLE